MLRSRRSLLVNFLYCASLPLVATRSAQAQDRPDVLERTPQCTGASTQTLPQTEGPFFKPKTPMRHELNSDGSGGERITLAGFVVDTQCRPVPNALVDIWHADHLGRYDNAGFRYRGHHHSDDRGRWWFSTIMPAAYPGRTRHYHFKVHKSGGKLLTTQLYFPDEPLNRSDTLFNKGLAMAMSKSNDGRFARFDFVV